MEKFQTSKQMDRLGSGSLFGKGVIACKSSSSSAACDWMIVCAGVNMVVNCIFYQQVLKLLLWTI